MLPDWLRAIVELLRNALRTLFPAGPRITSFSPTGGWPGTILAVRGSGFSTDRDGNAVVVGGAVSLVLDAAPDQLRVLAGPGTATGPIQVTVAGRTAASARPFELLPWPDGGDMTQAGPPAFFHGPQEGTPQRGVANQPVLVILCYPTDHDPGNAVARQALRDAEIASFADANRFWQEASYGSTSWNLTFTNWLALPRNRNFYMWQQEDIDEARRALLRGTRRGADAAGTTVCAGHLGNGLSVINAASPTAPSEQGEAGLGGAGAGVRTVGTRAYVAAGAAGLVVVDVTTASAPTVVATVPAGGWMYDVDVDGGVLAAAAGEAGLLVFDLTNPASPVQVGSLGFGADWATAVRLAGGRAYVASGSRLRVVDVSDPSSPTVLGDVSTQRWAMGLDVAGTICAVATDGDGLHLYDVTNPVPVERSVLRTALRTHAVDLDGGFAYVATADGGLRVIDVSDPAAPAEAGQLATSAPAFHVKVTAGRAYLSLGADTLSVVDVSTPATPVLRGSVELSSTSDPNLSALRDALDTAQRLQALTQRRDALMVHALQAAQAAGFNLNAFEGLIVVVNGPFLRGQSWTSNGFTHEGASVAFSEAKGVIYMATGSHWGRKAHEIGHWLGMWDIYTDWHPDGTYTPGTAAPWCMAGNHDSGPLFSGHQIHEKMRFFTTTAPNANVVERIWSATAPALDETFDIVAHDAVEDATPNRIHLLKLVVAQGLIYFVEVRQRPATEIFDQNIAATNAVQGLVVVTRATEGTTISNTQERPIMLFGAIDVNERVVDAARRLEIIAESRVQDRPLVYRVRVRWNQPVPANPDGQFDLSITEWDTSRWETVDIWVDSPRNNTGGTQVYEFHEPGDTGQPILNGDRPWVHRVNKIYARIRNTGGVAVDDVYVSFYVNSPPGIGDNGDWATLGTKHVPTIPAYDPGVPESGTVIVEHDWIPAGSKHTCIKVGIMPRIGEIEPNNNMAQENVAAFDSAASSSHQPVLLEAEVRSPFVVWRRVDLLVHGLPNGWHAVVDRSWVWLPPRGARPVRAVIWTDLGTSAGDQQERIPRLALPRIEGWTDFDHRYLPIGGILAAVKATRKVILRCSIRADGPRLLVSGCIVPAMAGVPITIEITDAKGQRSYIVLTTDGEGCVDLASSEASRKHVRLAPGEYTVQAFVTAGSEAAETECDAVRVVVQ